jgi:CHASE2 domain-containing sensor protein
MRDHQGRISAEEVIGMSTDIPEVALVKEQKLKQFFMDKVVLIGDAQPGASYDTANIPGQPDPQPGVYTHACAACTLIEAPLEQMGFVPGLFITTIVTLGLVVLNYLHWVKWVFSKKIVDHLSEIRLEIIHNVLSIAIVIFLTAFLAVGWHILWLNSVSSCIVFCLECYAVLYIGEGK